MDATILIVDDNEDILEYICTQLRPAYAVVKAAGAQVALNILKSESVDLVISDVMMPLMDGFEFCKAIKSDLQISHIPVILLTAKRTLKAKCEGLEKGADAYIEKPFSPKHLLIQIVNLLANRKRLKDFFATSPLAHLKSIAHTKGDEEFLEQLNKLIQDNIYKPDLDVQHLADLMNMSKSTLYRKINSISDLAPNELVNISRLKKAAELLTEGRYKIYEVSYMVGFSSQHHFARSFHKQFNMTASEFQQTLHSSVNDVKSL